VELQSKLGRDPSERPAPRERGEVRHPRRTTTIAPSVDEESVDD
jgi:hypothetical protein